MTGPTVSAEDTKPDFGPGYPFKGWGVEDYQYVDMVPATYIFSDVLSSCVAPPMLDSWGEHPRWSRALVPTIIPTA